MTRDELSDCMEIMFAERERVRERERGGGGRAGGGGGERGGGAGCVCCSYTLSCHCHLARVDGQPFPVQFVNKLYCGAFPFSLSGYTYHYLKVLWRQDALQKYKYYHYSLYCFIFFVSHKFSRKCQPILICTGDSGFFRLERNNADCRYVKRIKNLENKYSEQCMDYFNTI